MQWHSPFGMTAESAGDETGGWGFPGWHLECSVMAQKYLGTTIDLHGGGEDLRFPHHECEIAQAEALSGEPFSRYWLHTRFLQVEGQKMSKSAGNFLTVRDLTAAPEAGGRADWGAPVDAVALRLALMKGQYGKPMDFTQRALRDAVKNRRRIAEAAGAVGEAAEAARPGDADADLSAALDAAWTDALSAMADDLGTPAALAAALAGANAILDAARRMPLAAASADAAQTFLTQIDALLGIVGLDAAPAAGGDDPLAEQVETLIVDRIAARAAKDWARADAIRDEIEALGVEIMDSPSGTEWRRKV